MKVIFTESYEALKNKLSAIGGEWDESQINKKVLRISGGVMNWYESTGTIQFQGTAEGKKFLESTVKSILYPDEFLPEENDIQELVSNEDIVSPYIEKLLPCDISNEYLSGKFDHSEIIIGIVSAVGTETARVVNPLKDRLRCFGYNVEEIKVSSLLSSVETSNEYERMMSFQCLWHFQAL